MGDLGTRLVRAREARGLTLEDAERDTRISRRYLQALETEQFQVIPAPVYARGFLRSYSQYLGEDPQEILGLFPRDENDPEPASVINGPDAKGRATRQSPLAGHSASRPAWKRPARPATGARREPVSAVSQSIDFSSERGRAPIPDTALPPPPEPMIGVDIGVPAPARRLNPSGPSQARTITVVALACGGVVAVVLLALLISNLGGNSGGSGGEPGTTTQRTATPRAAQTPTAGASSGGIPVIKGVVPDVINKNVDAAKDAIIQAGFQPLERHEANKAARNTVIDQAPGSNTDLAEGGTVIIVVSDGPQ